MLLVVTEFLLLFIDIFVTKYSSVTLVSRMQLAAKTIEFRRRLQGGETLADIQAGLKPFWILEPFHHRCPKHEFYVLYLL